jgi:hypothetical protein
MRAVGNEGRLACGAEPMPLRIAMHSIHPLRLTALAIGLVIGLLLAPLTAFLGAWLAF